MLKSLASRVSFWHRAFSFWGIHTCRPLLDFPRATPTRSIARGTTPASAGVQALRHSTPCLGLGHLRGMPRSAGAGLSRASPASRRRDDRVAAAFALALPRVAAVRGRAGSVARQRIYSARRIARARPAGSESPASGSRTTPSRTRRSRSRTAWWPPGSTRPSDSDCDTVGCASTGNLANAVAAQAARAGIPGLDLHSSRSRGRQGRRHRGLRPETGSRPRQLRRRQPPLLAGGRPFRLGAREHQSSRLLRRGFEDHGLRDRRAARLASSDGCGSADGGRLAAHEARKGIPRVHRRRARVGRAAAALRGAGRRLFAHRQSRRARRRHDRSGRPATIARSIAIGNPADGRFAANAIRGTGGWAAAVSDEALVAGIRLLAESTGVFAETAGGTTVAAALALAASGRFNPDDESRALHYR